jgi:hypothetical protein
VVSLLRFGIDDILAIAGAENLHLNWDEEDEEPDAEDAAEQPEKPDFAYSTEQPATQDDEDDDGGALAEALRRAMQGKGVKS